MTANRCDKCFAFIIKSISGIADDVDLDIPKILEFLENPDFTFEEKMRAVAEACSPKMAKALLENGVKKSLVNKAFDYPDGNVFKCPFADLTKYPKTIAQFFENIGDEYGNILATLLS